MPPFMVMIVAEPVMVPVPNVSEFASVICTVPPARFRVPVKSLAACVAVIVLLPVLVSETVGAVTTSL